jgi:hypothetical protein
MKHRRIESDVRYECNNFSSGVRFDESYFVKYESLFSSATGGAVK